MSSCQKDVKSQIKKPCDGLRWVKLVKKMSKCQNIKKMSNCQKDVTCQIVKHLDYGGGSQKRNKLTS